MVQTRANIKIVTGSEERVTFSIQRNGKLFDLEIKALELNVPLSNGKNKRVEIIYAK